jgi:hypothetical protein
MKGDFLFFIESTLSPFPFLSGIDGSPENNRTPVLFGSLSRLATDHFRFQGCNHFPANALPDITAWAVARPELSS